MKNINAEFNSFYISKVDDSTLEKNDVFLNKICKIDRKEIKINVRGHNFVINKENCYMGFSNNVWKYLGIEDKVLLIYWETERFCKKHKIQAPIINYFNYLKDEIAQEMYNDNFINLNSKIVFGTKIKPYAVLDSLYHELTHFKDDDYIEYNYLIKNKKSISKPFQFNSLHYFDGTQKKLNTKLSKEQNEFLNEMFLSLYYEQPYEKNANASALIELKNTNRLISYSYINTEANQKDFEYIQSRVQKEYDLCNMFLGDNKKNIINIMRRFEKLLKYLEKLENQLLHLDREIIMSSDKPINQNIKIEKMIVLSKISEINETITKYEKLIIDHISNQQKKIKNNEVVEHNDLSPINCENY